MAAPSTQTPLERSWNLVFYLIVGLIFTFLVAPLFVFLPLSFNKEPYFTFSAGMFDFSRDQTGLRAGCDLYNSLRWYCEMLTDRDWRTAALNSFGISIAATIIATALGTLAALGLSRPSMPFRSLIMAVLVTPMIVPLIISALSLFAFYSLPLFELAAPAFLEPYLPAWLLEMKLAKTYPGIVLAHVVLGTPFVVITVTATLSAFDSDLIRAAQSLGANFWQTFFTVIMPLIMPGVVSGALFAFITSFDEVVVVFFMADTRQVMLPIRMFTGLREQISPTIMAVATLLILLSTSLMLVLEMLRRRSERLRTA